MLIESARSLKGSEREHLSTVYEELGFVDEDIRALQKGRMHKKAEAAVRLGVMRIAKATPYSINTLSGAEKKSLSSAA